MDMRDLVTGGAACAVPGSSSSSSNPLAALANTLIGSSSKIQENKEIPTSITPSSERQIYTETNDHLGALDQPFVDPNAPQHSDFLRGFHGSAGGELDAAWNDIHPPQLDHIYDTHPHPQQPILDGPPQRMLSSLLHSFVDSSRGGVPFRATPLPVLGLSEGDKQCIRDRSSIMARHIFADKSEDFINAQVNALLCSLDIDGDARAKGPLPGRFRELEDYWNESQGPLKPGFHAADGWVAEFNQQRMVHGANGWASEFEQQHGANGWASEFEQSQLTSVDQMRGSNISSLAAMEQTRILANTLAQNDDPKFQNSKFLQFVSKMSRGELIIDDNQVKQTALPAAGDWASEYQHQYNRSPAWADEFLSHGPDQWVNEFTTEREQHGPVDDQWVNEFSKLHVHDWVDEFGHQVGEGALGENSTDNWANAYDEFLNEQVAARQRSDTSRGVYVFSDMNPYVGHPNPLKEGQELFRKGLLSEAVLALEAEVLKNPDNAEGWRLLGIAHAENDDDQQAIAAMLRAQEADSTSLEVLLALGVSHTNELEQAAALKYLYGWLRHHPKYGTLAPPELSDSLYYADALDLKPNYVRAWANMGISYANQGMYEDSIRYYVRALAMNPKADNAWQYLRISLSCASRDDMLEACDSRNLDVLQKEFPL
nr:peroxisome biogenesis protein 5 [Quercus suber]